MREEPPDSMSLFAKLSRVIATNKTSESHETPLNEPEEPVDVEHEFEELMAQVDDVLQTDGVHFEDAMIKENLDDILLMLISLHGETHGKELLSDLDSLFETELSPGTVYPRLHDLEDEEILSMHSKIRTKEYAIADDDHVRSSVEETMVQHLAFGLLLYAFLYRL
ncbi:helix-turn-helix transcriptional regulator [Halostagnicola sp. A-GB9-2]|uniref:helix-turn-helix transcriptional regulator n=1 Tax=Halostagnicola sp. A-GB9-2 TaxID=3048066 RepID=UPI0024BFCB08|nr:helix-turn-helix transcriptional regulator [Halostagnicola sp. A-GB9-2]MDJ1432396.1 helix-turn-helix transcriptional regulator [Halostagnicola sp. A-GB9-2]